MHRLGSTCGVCFGVLSFLLSFVFCHESSVSPPRTSKLRVLVFRFVLFYMPFFVNVFRPYKDESRRPSFSESRRLVRQRACLGNGAVVVSYRRFSSFPLSTLTGSPDRKDSFSTLFFRTPYLGWKFSRRRVICTHIYSEMARLDRFTLFSHCLVHPNDSFPRILPSSGGIFYIPDHWWREISSIPFQGNSCV